MTDALQTRQLIREDIENHFNRRNMRIKSSYDVSRTKTANNQYQQLHKLNLDATIEIKSVYTPLSATRFHNQKEQRFNSATNSPRHHQNDIPNSLMIQDSKNIEMMNDANIIKLSYLPKLHYSLNNRKMRMDQYGSPWEQIKKIAQIHHTPILFEQHSVFGTSLTGFDGNVQMKPLLSPKTSQQRREKSADINQYKLQKDYNDQNTLVLKNEKIRQNLTQQELHNTSMDYSKINYRRNSMEGNQQMMVVDTFRDIQQERVKNEQIKQMIDYNQQQYMQKFWTSSFNKDKMTIQNQQNAKKKIFDKSLQAINIFDRKGNNSRDKQCCFSLIDDLNQQQQQQPCNQNFISDVKQNKIQIHNDLILNQPRVSTANSKNKIYFFQRKPQISPRRLEQMQNRVLQH